jgi:hypothetical protein
VTGGWRKLHNEGLHNLYSSPSIIRMIKSRTMRWAGHVARMGAKRNLYRILMIIIFWETTPCGSYKNRRFGGSYRLHLQGALVRAGYRAKLLDLV